MKTSKHLSFLLLTLTIAVGCSKKKYETTVSGHITEKNGSRGIAGAKVYLTELQFGTFVTNATYVDSTVSDVQGYYKMTAELKGEDYVIFAFADNYYPQSGRYEDEESLQDVIPGEDQSYNVTLWPIALLTMRFVNQSNAYFVNVNGFGGAGYHIDTPDATIRTDVRGNDTTRIVYFVYPGGQPQHQFVFCPGHDSTYVDIIY